MTKKLLAILAVLALAPFALAACGGDDDEDPTTSAETTEETTDTGGTGGGSGGAVEISADPGGELAYEQDSVTAPAGPVTISFTNESSVPHDVRVEGSDGEIGGTDVITGDTTEAEVEVEPGDYTFYCSVDGHRELGMEGTLTAE